jgi:hypothetical protein
MGWTTDCRGIRRPRAPRYLIRDRDGAYGNDVRRRLQSLNTYNPRHPLRPCFSGPSQND